jgi:hypothetical protein
MGSTRESWPPPGTACSIRNLQHLSEATGGFAAVDTNDVAPAFGRILEESSEFYVVAYETPASAKPGQFRALRVRTSRHDRGEEGLPPASACRGDRPGTLDARARRHRRRPEKPAPPC